MSLNRRRIANTAAHGITILLHGSEQAVWMNVMRRYHYDERVGSLRDIVRSVSLRGENIVLSRRHGSPLRHTRGYARIGQAKISYCTRYIGINTLFHTRALHVLLSRRVMKMRVGVYRHVVNGGIAGEFTLRDVRQWSPARTYDAVGYHVIAVKNRRWAAITFTGGRRHLLRVCRVNTRH